MTSTLDYTQIGTAAETAHVLANGMLCLDSQSRYSIPAVEHMYANGIVTFRYPVRHDRGEVKVTFHRDMLFVGSAIEVRVYAGECIVVTQLSTGFQARLWAVAQSHR